MVPEVPDHRGGDRGIETALPAGDRGDRVEQVLGPDVLEQEAGRAGGERLEDQLVGPEGGQHQHPGGRELRGDPPGGLDAVHLRHPQVQHRDVGLGAVRLRHGSRTVADLGDDDEVLAAPEHRDDPVAHELLVLGDEDPVRSLTTTPARSGSPAVTT